MSNTPPRRPGRDPRGKRYKELTPKERNNYEELTQSKEGIRRGSEVIFSYKDNKIKGRVLNVYSRKPRPQQYISFEWKDSLGDKHTSHNIQVDKLKILRTAENIESELRAARRRDVRNKALNENWGQNETLGKTPNQVHWEQFFAMASEKNTPTSDQNLIKLKGVSRKKKNRRYSKKPRRKSSKKPRRKQSTKTKSKKSKK